MHAATLQFTVEYVHWTIAMTAISFRHHKEILKVSENDVVRRTGENDAKNRLLFAFIRTTFSLKNDG